MSGGPERFSGYFAIIGASTLELNGPLGVVDPERTPDNRWSYLAQPCYCDECLGSRVPADWTGGRVVRRWSRCTVPV